jgi:hypothetical protein
MNLYGQIEMGLRRNVIKPLVSAAFTVALLAALETSLLRDTA